MDSHHETWLDKAVVTASADQKQLLALVLVTGSEATGGWNVVVPAIEERNYKSRVAAVGAAKRAAGLAS